MIRSLLGRGAVKPRAVTSASTETQLGSKRSYPGGYLKVLKRRRASVKTIGKITKTMKVVASSKLAASQAKAEQGSPFFRTFGPLLAAIPKPEADAKIITLPVCTDKGMCGSTNNALLRSLLKRDLSGSPVVVWGDKGCSAFENNVKYKTNVRFSGHPSQKTALSFTEVGAFVNNLMKQEFDYVRILFNRMETSSTPIQDELLIPSYGVIMSQRYKNKDLVKYEIDAVSVPATMQSMTEFMLAAAMSYAVVNNQAVEIFQRRNSMDNASKNAKEVVQKLTLEFNRERQAMITTELGEITSGAAAVDEMLKKGS